MTDDTEARFLCPECRTSERSSPEVWVAVLENFTVPCDACGLLAKQVEVRRVNGGETKP